MDEITPAPRRHARTRQGEHRLESRWVCLGGSTLHALASIRPGPPEDRSVVLVHGLGMSSRYMAPLAKRLSPNFRVYAPDLPGFGLSSKPSHALTVPELADSLAAFLDGCMDMQRAAFVGNSLGCEILVEFALRYPERVESLVLQGPTPDPGDRTAVQKVGFFAVTCLLLARGASRRLAVSWQAEVQPAVAAPAQPGVSFG